MYRNLTFLLPIFGNRVRNAINLSGVVKKLNQSRVSAEVQNLKTTNPSPEIVPGCSRSENQSPIKPERLNICAGGTNIQKAIEVSQQYMTAKYWTPQEPPDIKSSLPSVQSSINHPYSQFADRNIRYFGQRPDLPGLQIYKDMMSFLDSSTNYPQ